MYAIGLKPEEGTFRFLFQLTLFPCRIVIILLRIGKSHNLDYKKPLQKTMDSPYHQDSRFDSFKTSK